MPRGILEPPEPSCLTYCAECILFLAVRFTHVVLGLGGAALVLYGVSLCLLFHVNVVTLTTAGLGTAVVIICLPVIFGQLRNTMLLGCVTTAHIVAIACELGVLVYVRAVPSAVTLFFANAPPGMEKEIDRHWGIALDSLVAVDTSAAVERGWRDAGGCAWRDAHSDRTRRP